KRAPRARALRIAPRAQRLRRQPQADRGAARPHRQPELAAGLDLRAVHQAPRRRVERVAAVQGAAVVPDHHVADAPLMAEDELRLRGVGPELVEQRLALGELESLDVAVAPPAEEQHLAPGLGMLANQ